MPKLKGELEAFNLEIARHQTRLDDLLSIKVEKGVPVIDKGRTKDLQSQDSKAKRHGDSAVSLVMAVRATYMEGGAIEFTAVPKHSRGFDNLDADDTDIDLPEQSAW
jgi:phage FluMu gp28-like protein